MGQSEIEFLGHTISDKGVRTTLDKQKELKEVKEPKNVKELRAMLGLAGYYRNFVPNYAQIAEPMTRLLRKGKEFVWGNEQKEAWKTLCDRLSEGNTLSGLEIQGTQTVVLTCDASH